MEAGAGDSAWAAVMKVASGAMQDAEKIEKSQMPPPAPMARAERAEAGTLRVARNTRRASTRVVL